MPASRSLKAGR